MLQELHGDEAYWLYLDLKSASFQVAMRISAPAVLQPWNWVTRWVSEG